MCAGCFAPDTSAAIALGRAKGGRVERAIEGDAPRARRRGSPARSGEDGGADGTRTRDPRRDRPVF